MTRVTWVELCQDRSWDPLQHLLGEDPEQLPADVKRLKDSTVLIVALCNEVLLELAKELEVEQVIWGESLLADHRLRGLDVLANGVAGVQLVGNVRVVLPGHALANGRLHQPRQ